MQFETLDPEVAKGVDQTDLDKLAVLRAHYDFAGYNRRIAQLTQQAADRAAAAAQCEREERRERAEADARKREEAEWQASQAALRAKQAARVNDDPAITDAITKAGELGRMYCERYAVGFVRAIGTVPALLLANGDMDVACDLLRRKDQIEAAVNALNPRSIVKPTSADVWVLMAVAAGRR